MLPTGFGKSLTFQILPSVVIAKIDLLYGSPESIVGDDKFQGIIANDFYRKIIVAAM